jgi:hypothetical protein
MPVFINQTPSLTALPAMPSFPEKISVSEVTSATIPASPSIAPRTITSTLLSPWPLRISCQVNRRGCNLHARGICEKPGNRLFAVDQKEGEHRLPSVGRNRANSASHNARLYIWIQGICWRGWLHNPLHTYKECLL